MKQLYTLSICLLLSLIMNAQQADFKGVIYADSLMGQQINIINLSQKTGTVNKTDGSFAIKAQPGDTLFFSSVNYQPHQLQVTKKMLQQKSNAVYLFLEVTELEEVTISSIDLSGHLVDDANKLAAEIDVFDPASVGLPVAKKPLSVEDRRLYTAATGGPLGVLINGLSGRTAMLKRLKSYAVLESRLQQFRDKVPLHVFTEDCGVPEDYIADFLYFCAKDNNFKLLANTGDTPDLIAFLFQKKEAYYHFKEWEKN